MTSVQPDHAGSVGVYDLHRASYWTLPCLMLRTAQRTLQRRIHLLFAPLTASRNRQIGPLFAHAMPKSTRASRQKDRSPDRTMGNLDASRGYTAHATAAESVGVPYCLDCGRLMRQSVLCLNLRVSSWCLSRLLISPATPRLHPRLQNNPGLPIYTHIY